MSVKNSAVKNSAAQKSPLQGPLAQSLPARRMFVHASNDLGILADHLAEILTEPGPGPLEREVVLIQSAGMQRWLSRELSLRLGVLANADFPFPRAFVQRTLDQLFGDAAEAARYERDSLRWEIFRQLSELPADPRYAGIRRYLDGDDPSRRLLLLAGELAHHFDQYLTYRPRLLSAWSSGADSEDFQSDLWRRLLARLGSHHLAERSRRLLHEVTDEELRRVLPSRLALVGGAGLPPLYLQLLARIGQVVPMHLLSFSVSQEYFAELYPSDDPFPELGAGAHPLLITMGKVGGDFQRFLQDQPHEDVPSEYRLPSEQTLLGALQRDITLAVKRDASERLPGHLAKDGTITLDSFHSPLREVEGLLDRLLGWFHEDPTLLPDDVVVMVPNIETYAPLIEAVFQPRLGEAPKIPHRIFDQSEGATNPAARTLLLGLEVLESRFRQSEVLDLLQSEPVLARYGLSIADLERVALWVQSAGIRFGADAEHLAALGLGHLGGQSWEEGLRRLLLGYAQKDDGHSLFRGLLPIEGIGPGDGNLLGQLAKFVSSLLSLRRRLAPGGLIPSVWQEILTDLARALLGDGERTQWDTAAVSRAVFDLCQTAHETTPEARLSVGSMRLLLEEALSGQRPSGDFLSYGVTFCALLPMRAIPFRRICVLGLDQDGFPRPDGSSALDLLRRDPRPGDRSLRGEDRQLFLELLLSARERLALSYVGRSIQDDRKRPPSVVIDELRETLTDMLQLESTEALPATQHPLQPFSPRYFAEGSDLGSYDQDAFRGAVALANAAAVGRSKQPFVTGSLVAAGRAGSPGFGVVPGSGQPAFDSIEVEALVRFWKDPLKAFLSRLMVRIEDEIEHFEDREKVHLDPLGRSELGRELLDKMMRDVPIVPEVELARGRLPPAAAGRVVLSQVAGEATNLEALARAVAGDSAPALVDVLAQVELTEADSHGVGIGPQLRVVGRLELRGERRFEIGFVRPKARARLGHWIRHLCVCASGRQVESILVARGEDDEKPTILTLSALSARDAARHLEPLCAGYFQGQLRPLCFVPEAALDVVEWIRREQQKATQDASPAEIEARAWDRVQSSLEKSLLYEIFRDEDARLGLSSDRRAELLALARTVFEPMIARESWGED